MTQSPTLPMHESETASPPRVLWPRPPYHGLRRKLVSQDGGFVTSARSRATSESVASDSRSPSPSVTPSESSNYYAPSTSSWATSAGPGTEFGFSNDDDVERCGQKWDDESPRMPLDRPSTPARRLGARFIDRSSTRSSSRPSSLRNTVSVYEDSDAETPCYRPRMEETDTSESECDTARRSETETEADSDDNEWSGQNGNLEAAVISAVDGDLALAAHLIPLLHRDLSLAVKSKIESWQCLTAHGNEGASSGGSGGGRTSYTETSPDQSPPIPRKRRRTESNGRGRKTVDGWEGEDGDDEDDSKRPTPPVAGEPQRMLACPFHKRDSTKYGIQHGNSGSGKKHRYRACMGPGFKSIQRLKEHLKRVHSPVQCERCHEIFPGTDRAACLSQLADHRKQSIPCELGDASEKEGIDEAQWATLDKQNRKKNQETHRVEKWFEIWDVLFPGAGRPRSPWHDVRVPYLASSSSSSQDAEDFANLFVNILEHKVGQGDIDLRNPDNLRASVKSVAKLTFKTYINLHGKLASPATSSGESQKRLSFAGRSSTQLSDPMTAASHQLSATTAGTSIASGQHGSTPAGRGPYAMSPASPFGMIPRSMAQQPFMPAASLGQVPVPTGNVADMAPPGLPPTPLQGNVNVSGIPTFGAMNPMGSGPDPYANHYYSYVFAAPPPQGSWGTGNVAAFPPGAHMAGVPQDFGMGGTHFFSDAQNFGAGPTEGA